MADSILKQKSYEFSVQIVKFCQAMSKNKNVYVVINQLLKAGTSVGANIREAEFAQSKNDFISKMSIALKEANETEYWLVLLKDTGIISEIDFRRFANILTDILRMLIATVKTAKKQ